MKTRQTFVNKLFELLICFHLSTEKIGEIIFWQKFEEVIFFEPTKISRNFLPKKIRFVAKLVLKRILAKVLGPGQKIGPFILGLKNRIASSCHVSSLPLDLPNLVDTFSKSSELSCAGILIRPKLFSWRVGRASRWCLAIFSLWRKNNRWWPAASLQVRTVRLERDTSVLLPILQGLMRMYCRLDRSGVEIVSNMSGTLIISPPPKLVKNLLFCSRKLFSLSTSKLTYQGSQCEPSSPLKLKNSRGYGSCSW